MSKIFFGLFVVATLITTLLSVNITFAASAIESCPLISTWSTLQLGSNGKSVMQLQKVLNLAPDTMVAASGIGSSGNETNFFGALTHQAVIKFQEKYQSEILTPAGILSGNGYVGLYTRTKAQLVCTAATGKLSSANSTSFSVAETQGTTASKTTVVTTSNNSAVCATERNTCKVGIFRDVRDSSTFYKWSCQPNSIHATAASCSVKKNTGIEPPIVQPPITGTPIVNPVPLLNSTPTKVLNWGVYSGYSASDLTNFESLVGKSVNMKAVFTNWNSSFPTDAGSGLKAANKTLVIYWEQYGVTLDSIIAGESDAYIEKFAAEAKAYGGKVMLAPFHEMNGNWDPWGGAVGTNSPAKVVTAWRHVREVFGNQPNVSFVWAVNNISVPNTTSNAISNYYPGDAYVDYVAVDGFNFGSPWQSFDTVFAEAFNEVAVYKKPIYILSIGSAEGPNKAAWITDAFKIQAPKYPLLHGWIWFNENKEKDWRVNSDPNSLAAFKEILP